MVFITLTEVHIHPDFVILLSHYFVHDTSQTKVFEETQRLWSDGGYEDSLTGVLFDLETAAQALKAAGRRLCIQSAQRIGNMLLEEYLKPLPLIKPPSGRRPPPDSFIPTPSNF